MNSLFKTKKGIRAPMPHLAPHLCVLPWIHSHVTNAGEVMVCCASGSGREAYPILGNVNDTSIFDIFYSSHMERIRRQMLSGEWPSECETCKNREALGMTSFRMESNKRYLQYFSMLSKDLVNFQPTIRTLDIRPSNICNFRCRMCSGYASSQWFREHNLIYPELKLSKPAIYLSARGFWSDYESLLNSLEEIHIAGGEPLLMEEQFKVLNDLLLREKADIFLYYDTNLSVLSYKDCDIISLWKRFRNIRVSLSLDGVGEQGEYIRYGLVYNDWVRNARKLIERAPHVEIAMHFVIMVFNIIDFRLHYDSIRQLKIVNPELVSYTFLEWPPYLSIQAMPPKLKRWVADYLQCMLAEDDLVTGSDRAMILAIIKFMKAKNTHRLYWPKFKRTTRQLDEIRGQDGLSLFPVLRSYVDD